MINIRILLFDEYVLLTYKLFTTILLKNLPPHLLIMTRLPLKKVRVQNNTEHNLYLSHQKELRLLPNIFIGLLTFGVISSIVMLWHTNGSAFFKEQMNLVQLQQYSLNNKEADKSTLIIDNPSTEKESSLVITQSKINQQKDILYNRNIQNTPWLLTIGCQENNSSVCTLLRQDPTNGNQEVIIENVRIQTNTALESQINFAKTQSEPALILLITYAQNNVTTFELIKVDPVTSQVISQRTVTDQDKDFFVYRA